MKTKQKILICAAGSLLLLLGIFSQAQAEFTLNSLIQKTAAISIDGKQALDILNEITQEGELDEAVPKRRIANEQGQIETIFVFDVAGNQEDALLELQNYFSKEEGFEAINIKEESGIKAVELQKGTTKILLAQKDSILIEDRLEGFLAVPEAIEGEEITKTEDLAAGPAEKPAVSFSWLWLVVIGGLAVIVVVVVIVIKGAARS